MTAGGSSTMSACFADTEEARARLVAGTVRRHALGWLVAANAVGVLLANELLWPAVGDALAPLSYGRWMPLHMNWQLYGWCALPLVGVLMKWILVTAHPRVVGHVRVALGAWSLALAAGGVSWLAGVTSGKVFLDWHGWARPLLPMAMVVLWTVLAAHAWWRGAGYVGREARPTEAGAAWLRWGWLAGLVAVPSVLYWSAGRRVYPAVNPDSGGATGAALLVSTLGIVAVFGFLPGMLGVRRRDDQSGAGRAVVFWGAWIGSMAAWAAIDHGNASHHAWQQIAGLGLLGVWVPLLAWWWFGYAWSVTARRWMNAALMWWAVLVVTGWLTFLPGWSERLKFTNGLVAHAHLAMAGLLTTVNGLILNELDPARPIGRGLGWWQGAAAVHVVVLLAVGWFERDYATEFFDGAWWVQAGYGVRWAAGVVMAAVSVRWWREAWV